MAENSDPTRPRSMTNTSSSVDEQPSTNGTVSEPSNAESTATAPPFIGPQTLSDVAAQHQAILDLQQGLIFTEDAPGEQEWVLVHHLPFHDQQRSVQQLRDELYQRRLDDHNRRIADDPAGHYASEYAPGPQGLERRERHARQADQAFASLFAPPRTRKTRRARFRSIAGTPCPCPECEFSNEDGGFDAAEDRRIPRFMPRYYSPPIQNRQPVTFDEMVRAGARMGSVGTVPRGRPILMPGVTHARPSVAVRVTAEMASNTGQGAGPTGVSNVPRFIEPAITASMAGMQISSAASSITPVQDNTVDNQPPVLPPSWATRTVSQSPNVQADSVPGLERRRSLEYTLAPHRPNTEDDSDS